MKVQHAKLITCTCIKSDLYVQVNNAIFEIVCSLGIIGKNVLCFVIYQESYLSYLACLHQGSHRFSNMFVSVVFLAF